MLECLPNFYQIFFILYLFYKFYHEKSPTVNKIIYTLLITRYLKMKNSIKNCGKQTIYIRDELNKSLLPV